MRSSLCIILKRKTNYSASTIRRYSGCLVGGNLIATGYHVKQVPISWINRSPEIGASSFRLIRVGGGHWRAL
ncbi:MAG: hypothetical protein DMF19_03815 [Verrucomicrobia bacterium]|nr:MAG: hypothetical protein DMF19_03815 [Verrucomicrobiota bacterium]